MDDRIFTRILYGHDNECDNTWDFVSGRGGDNVKNSCSEHTRHRLPHIRCKYQREKKTGILLINRFFGS